MIFWVYKSPFLTSFFKIKKKTLDFFFFFFNNEMASSH